MNAHKAAILIRGSVLAILALGCLTMVRAADEPVDMQRVRELRAAGAEGETLTPEEQAYYDRGLADRNKRKSSNSKEGSSADGNSAKSKSSGEAAGAQTVGASRPRDSTGLIPITELGAKTYKGEDGGLYGGGSNAVPAAHLAAVKRQEARIEPLDAEGKPSPDGKIVFTSIGMSNTTIEFSMFEQLAADDPLKSPAVLVVDGAQGGRVATEWAGELELARQRPANHGTGNGAGDPWPVAFGRLKAAGVTPKQVQAVWIKMAERRPHEFGEFPAHAEYLADMIAKTLSRVHMNYPNCRIAYLSSRIYAGYGTTTQNPEPFAYESAFATRWVILDQIKGSPSLNFDPVKGPVMAPAVVWGPYMWADGVKPRAGDGLVWLRDEFRNDGTHPSGPGGAAIEKARHEPGGARSVTTEGGDAGRRKVAGLLMKFAHEDPLVRVWYLKADAR